MLHKYSTQVSLRSFAVCLSLQHFFSIMQIKSILLLLVIGAVAVLAKKGSSEEKDRWVQPILVYPNTQPVAANPDFNRKSNRYPQGRPFQTQSYMGEQFPQMTAYYPQPSGSVMGQPTAFVPQGGQGYFVPQGGQGYFVPQGMQGSFGPQGGQGSLGLHGGQASFRPQGGKKPFGPQGGQGSFGPQGMHASFGPHGGQGSLGPQGGQASFGPQGMQGSFGPQGGQASFKPQGGKRPYGQQGGKGHFKPQGSPNSFGPQMGEKPYGQDSFSVYPGMEVIPQHISPNGPSYVMPSAYPGLSQSSYYPSRPGHQIPAAQAAGYSGNDVLNVWPYPRPGRGPPKPFKFKHPKHHVQIPVYVVGRPEYSYNGPQMPSYMPQQPQYVPQGFQQPQYIPQEPQRPQYIPQEPQRPQYIPQEPQRPQYIPQEPQRPQYIPQESQRPQIIPYEPQRPQIIPQESQRPQIIPYEPQRPQIIPQEPEGVTQNEAKLFIQNLMKEMQDVSLKAYTEFEKVDAEIERSRKNMENGLKSQFQTFQLSMEGKLSREMQQAVKNGKDEEELKNCLEERQEEFEREAQSDIQRTTDCINDATERARKMVAESRNSFTETSVANSMQSKSWAQEMNSCAEKKDYVCAQEKMALISQKAKATIEEGNRQIQKLHEAPRQQMIQLNYCRQNFLQDLREMRVSYSSMVKECVVSVEVPKPVEVPGKDSDESGSGSDSNESKVLKKGKKE